MTSNVGLLRTEIAFITSVILRNSTFRFTSLTNFIVTIHVKPISYLKHHPIYNFLYFRYIEINKRC